MPGAVVGPPAALPDGVHAERGRGDPDASTSSRASTPSPRSRRSARSATRCGPLLQVAEIRTVAADTLWLSPQYGQDTVGFHFTWKREPELVGRLAGALEVALAPFAPRPHWGKVFLAGSATIADRYERLPDFARLAERLDPRGAFRNDWLERHVLS